MRSSILIQQIWAMVNVSGSRGHEKTNWSFLLKPRFIYDFLPFGRREYGYHHRQLLIYVVLYGSIIFVSARRIEWYTWWHQKANLRFCLKSTFDPGNSGHISIDVSWWDTQIGIHLVALSQFDLEVIKELTFASLRRSQMTLWMISDKRNSPFEM